MTPQQVEYRHSPDRSIDFFCSSSPSDLLWSSSKSKSASLSIPNSVLLLCFWILENDILRVGCLLHHLFDPYCYDLIFVGVNLNAGSIQGRSQSEWGSHLVFLFQLLL